MHEAFEDIPCNLCGGHDTVMVYPSTLPQDSSIRLEKRFAPADHISGNDQIVRCKQCGLMYTNPRVKPDYIWQGYSEAVDQKYVSQAELRIKTFQRNLKKIGKYMPKKGKGLDIGCAAGFFLKVASDQGWSVEGVEPNKTLGEFGRTHYGVKIHSRNFLSLEMEKESLDLITLWDVLEHVPDPKAYIKKAFQLLKRGGFIFVNFPDTGSIFARLTGQKWWFVSPVHIYYFDRKNIKRLFEEQGFKVRRIEMHWQTLELGYLFERLHDYSPFPSRIGMKICKALHLSGIPIRYYASQALAIIQKP